MIRTLIADDEPPAIVRLKKLLQPFEDFDIIGEASDGLSTLTLVEEKNPDLLFLDIDMPELSGLDVARTLGVSGPMIVFTTAYNEYALEAFESSAIDYLVKPINKARLDFSIEKIRKSHSKTKNLTLDLLFNKLRQKDNPVRLAVRVGNKYEVFDPKDISAILSKDHYSQINVNGRELLSDDSLESIYSRLDCRDFIRIHRGAIINVKLLQELRREGDRKYTAILSDRLQTQVPVSRERLPKLKQILGLF